jgi:hypothetical protein
MATPSLVSGSFAAQVFPTTEPGQTLTVSEFINTPKPGNVAVCLSGGGSRAMSAGMGQLNALGTAQLLLNVSLLSQVKALSTVSGGSWLGGPFVYLPSSVSDSDFLGGPYVDPSQLTPAGLTTFPPGCIGAQITTDFTLLDLLFQAVLLYGQGVPPEMLWQTLIALHLLAPYGLFPFSGSADTPASLFTYNQATLNAIVQQNPSLHPVTANLVSAQPRPYFVCNTAMFVTVGGQALLAPVQATSFWTGIVSIPPNATDTNGLPVGGGGVTSFAFNSAPTAFSPSTETASVQQQRQWAIADIVGASSAAFAATLQQLGSAMATNPQMLAAVMGEHRPAAAKFLQRTGVDTTVAERRLASTRLAAAQGHVSEAAAFTSFLRDLVPAYQYWPVLNPPINQPINTTAFADGGSLDNSGVASVLAYSDIQNLLVFTNTSTPMTQDANGVIVVDESLPPLFGYQPYVPGRGYMLYQGAISPYQPLYQHNQVFPSASFQDLLDNLWSASGQGTYQNPPLYTQQLTTMSNAWFNVAAGRPVTVLWTYLERARSWYDQLALEVQNVLGPFDNMLGGFPHYSTFDTELTATEINLLANYTAWVIMTTQSKFTSLFQA